MLLDHLPQSVRITEVGPRDGLQNEKIIIPTDVKLAYIERLIASGITEIEVASFVSPKWVLQMADGSKLVQQLPQLPHIKYKVLIPNLQGWDNMGNFRPHEILVFGSASETFAQKNTNCSIKKCLERFAPVIEKAHANHVLVCGSISCAFGCPYEGDISLIQVNHVVQLMKHIGVDSISMADTIGVGTPKKTQQVMEIALNHFPSTHVKGHFHNTYGQALANILVCLSMDIAQFDTSSAGLGGCPYAPGAKGNVATEDVLFMLNGLGIHTAISMDKLKSASGYILSFTKTQ